jgi:S1-C subfamily serine protease
MSLSRQWIWPVLGVWLLAGLGCGVCGLTQPRSQPAPTPAVALASPTTSVAPTPTTLPTAAPTRATRSAPSTSADKATPTRLPANIIAQAEAIEKVIIDVSARVSPSVVNVRVIQELPASIPGATPDPDQLPFSTSEGSGFVYDSRGYIITNQHVIDGASDIEVILANGDSYPAVVIGSDKDSDLAVLEINAPADVLPAVELGDSSTLQVGQRVIAIGNPFGLAHTVTSGIVSSLGRVIPRDTGYSMSQMIQTDAAINPGNSGGPLLDIRGRVVGVNSMIVSSSGSSSGVGFAIPVQIVQRVVPALISSGKYAHPWLGVSGMSLTSRMAKALGAPVERGALIRLVIAGGPAEQAGLRGGNRPVDIPGMGTIQGGGDIVTAINDCDVKSFDDLITCIENASVGQVVTVTFVRDGETKSVNVTLQKRPER